MNYLVNLLKRQLVLILLCLASGISFSQNYTATGVPLALNIGTTLNPTCGAVSSSSITFNVTGVGTLSASNQLLEIDMRLRTPGSTGRLAVSVFLVSPSGTCVQIATQMGDVSTATGTNKNLDYKFRAPNACLNKYPDYEATNFPMRHFEQGVDSRTGVFSTVGDISTAFTGENADGTWTMYFGRTNSLYNTLPSVQSAELTFGENVAVSGPNPADGTSCATAIVWDGSPICATTAGKTDTGNRPGTAGCSWLSTSENNLWIQFTPNNPDVCINISGVNYVSGTPSGVQSIIVESATPCSGSWTLVNCPRNNIYSENTGSVMSHNHCFTATPGNTYYLVVDGNAGAVTELYLTGINDLPVILPVTLTSFTSKCVSEGTLLSWETATELNNDYYSIEYSEDGLSWETRVTIKGAGTTNHTQEYSWLDRKTSDFGYYRLSQTDYDGTHVVLKTIIVTCNNGDGIDIVPNPNNGTFRVVGLAEGDQVEIIDPVGRVLERKSATTNFSQHEIQKQSVGVYVARITTGKLTLTKKFVIR